MSNIEGANLFRGEPSREFEERGYRQIELTSGYLPFDTPPFVDDAMEYAIRNKNELKQEGRAGLRRYRQAIADDFQTRHGVEVNPDRIMATAGSSGALRIIFSAFNGLENPHNQLWVPELGYGYEDIARYSGLRTTARYPLKDGKPDTAGIGGLLEAESGDGTIILMINSPANPTGRLADQDTLAELAERVKYKNKGGKKVLVVEDNVFSTCVFDDKTHASILPLLPDDTVVVDSTSKRLANLQNGWGMSPEWLFDTLVAIRDDTGGVPPLGQYGAAHILEEEGRGHVEQARQEMEKKRNLMGEGLAEIDGLEYEVPDGGFFFFVRQPYGNSQEFSTWLKEKYKIGVTDGRKYTRARHPDECNAVRISFAVQDEQIEEGVERIGQAVAEWDPEEARALVARLPGRH